MVTFSTAAWCINLPSRVQNFMHSHFLFPYFEGTRQASTNVQPVEVVKLTGELSVLFE